MRLVLRDGARQDVDAAQTSVRRALGLLTEAANTVDESSWRLPGHGEVLETTSNQLWAMAGLAREVEARLAGVHESIRREERT